ncbi:hypothetical protein Patl1_23251 [Pistacia atlantica]|uniref:Uncharacterized protein n=1 Tax=Pistacia atlantica TaxID=434234 RepID=A0ACC1A178_9ROSI|nr:hypothetical protein Patl1_23251 [Pistacia atlantica]
MAARGNSAVKQQRTSQGFRRALASAILECHKLEISSLGFCHAHNKLVDVHGMCENCLFSFATVNKSNTETYRLLVGKLGEDYSFGFDEEPLPQGDHNNNQSSVKHCSCCNEPWIPRGLHYLKKRNEKRSIPIRATHMESSGPDPLSHVGYTELKITSDTESEVLSDDDDADALDTAWRNLNWEQIGFKADPSELTELISLNDVPSSSNAGKTSIDVSIDSELINHNVPPPSNFRESLFEVTEEMKLISLDEVSPSSNAETPVNESEETGLNYHNVHLSSDAKRPVHVSEESKLISANDVPSSPKGRDTHPEVSKDGKVILPDDIPPMSNAAQSPVVVSEESKLISVSNISSTGMDTPSEMSKDSKVILLDDVPPVSNPIESAVNVLEESKIISVDDVPSPSNGRDTPEVSEDSKVILPDDVPQLSNDTGIFY